MNLAARTHDYGRVALAQLAPLLKREGLTAAQLVLPKAFEEIASYGDVTQMHLEQIKESFQENGIQLSILGCYMDLGNPDAGVRKQAIETFCTCLRYAKLLGAQMVGTETAYPRLSKAEQAQWFPYMMDSLHQLAQAAQREEVTMAIEPVYWHPLADLETTVAVFDALNSPYVNMIFDPANVLENPNIDQGAYWKQWFAALGNKIAAVHMKDFVLKDGTYTPVPLGEGVMQYEEIFRFLKRSCPDVTIVREELDPKTAQQDIAYIQTLWKQTKL